MAALPALEPGHTEPDLVLYNGNFITMDSAQRRAQAVAIAGDRLLAVCSNDEVRSLAGVRNAASISAARP